MMNKLSKIFASFVAVSVLVMFGYFFFTQGTRIYPVSKNDPTYRTLIAGGDEALLYSARYNRYKRNPKSSRYLRWAIAKFPDRESCVDGDNGHLRWGRIRSEQQLEVCVYHLIKDMSLEHLKDWLDATKITYSQQPLHSFVNGEYVETGHQMVSIDLENNLTGNEKISQMTWPGLVFVRLLDGVAALKTKVNRDGKFYWIEVRTNQLL